MKIAIIHDWLITYRGGEKVLSAFLELYPKADVYSLIAYKGQIPETIPSRVRKVSFIQRLPFAKRFYRYYLPLMPMAIEGFDLSGYDLVISLSHTVAKGVMIHPGTVHISYLFTPVRYAWDRYFDYFKNKKGLSRLFMDGFLSYMRNWDYITATRVDHFIAISSFIRSRIKKYYSRSSDLIFPPVDISRFAGNINNKRKDHYLVFSAFVPYKRLDLAVKAFTQSGRKLIVAGSGPGYKALKKLAKGHSNIVFELSPSDEKVVDLFSGAKGYVFPGVEAFGITMVESLASGTPVIAFNKGGSRDIIKEGQTGIFFDRQAVSALNAALTRFEAMEWNAEEISKSAVRFSKERFKKEIKEYINEKMESI